MELIILILIFIMLILFARKDKGIDTFSLSDFLEKGLEHKNFHSSMTPTNEFGKENKNLIDHINNFFNSNSGDINEDDDGGE